MAEIQLSNQLFEDIQQAVEKQEPGANPLVTIQYLAAVMGYILGSQPMPRDERAQFLEEVCAFAVHVFEDVDGSQQQQAAPPAADAFGIWEPN